jgi:cbb3-type cytochrome oxidase maturation protein
MTRRPIEVVPARSWLWLFGCLVVVLAALGFIYKLAMFIREALGAEAASFALVPVVVYLFVALGFVGLFVWALFSGQFQDVEGPKRRMLEREAEYERKGI